MKVRLSPTVAALSFGLAGFLVVLIEKAGTISARSGFVALTFVLLLYLWSQIMLVRRVHAERWLLNPAVLCSLMTFFMSFGFGNILYFLPDETLDVVGMTPEISPAMLTLMFLVLIGAIGMWMGYWSPLAASLSSPTRRKRFANLLRQSNKLNYWAIPMLLAVSAASRLISINLGVFGYSSNYDRLIELGGVTQYLSLLSSLGKLALVVAALEYYSDKSSIRAKALFFCAFGLEIIFGLLSGFKSAIAMPFLIVGICFYLKNNTLPLKWVLATLLALFLSFQIVEPFRDAKNSSNEFKGTSTAEIANLMIGAGNETKNSGDEKGNEFINFLARSSYAYIGSLGIEFSDSLQVLPEDSPEFLNNILFAPIYAVVPRAIWSGKPLGSLGLWYTQVVMGMPYSLSSTAMSPFTYLYFVGGGVAVFVGFFFIGFVQRLLLFLTNPFLYMSGAVVYLGLVSQLVVLGDSIDSLMISLIREFPLLLMVQWFIFQKKYNKNVPKFHT